MTSQPRSPSRRVKTLDWITFASFAIFSVVLVALVSHQLPWAFEFHENRFAAISAVGLVTNLILLVMLFRRPTHAAPTLWFACFIITDLLWGVFEFMQRMSITPQANSFWSHIIFSTTAFLPAFFYLFVRSYTNRSRTEGSNVVPAIVIGWTLFMACLITGDQVFPLSSFGPVQPWGFPAPISPISWWFVTCIGIFTVFGVARMVGFYREATSRKERQQAKVIILGASFLSFAAITTTFLLPAAFHIYTVPPLGVLANAIFAGSIIYTIYKYDTFSVNLAQVADTVLENMGEAVFVTDDDYRILYANRSAERLFAAPGSTIIDQSVDLIAEGRIAVMQKDWERPLATHINPAPIELNLNFENHPVTLLMQVSSVSSSQDGFAFVFSDISQLKSYSEKAFQQAKKLEEANNHLEDSQTALMDLLEESRQLQVQLRKEKSNVERKVVSATKEIQVEHARLQASINSLGIGFIMAAPDGSVLTFNREARQLVANGVGLKPSQMDNVDTKTLESVVLRTFDLKPKIDECLKTKQSITLTNLPLRDKTITVYLAPIIDHEAKAEPTLGAVILLEDVTEAVALQRSRDEFFSIASHELRTPLTAIRGNSQMIQDFYGSSLKDPLLKDMVKDIHDASIRLITIVNDFLDTSRLEQGKIEFKPEPVAADKLMIEVVNEIKTAGINPSVELIVKQPSESLPLVQADHDRLKQVFINLVSNGLKFTDKGSVTATFVVLPKAVAVLVADTGKGIPSASQGLLFRKFQQASDNILTRDSTRSTGLGLYISRLIMDGMGGEVALETSESGKGSIFRVIIPVAKVPRQPQKPKPPRSLEKSSISV